MSAPYQAIRSSFSGKLPQRRSAAGRLCLASIAGLLLIVILLPFSLSQPSFRHTVTSPTSHLDANYGTGIPLSTEGAASSKSSNKTPWSWFGGDNLNLPQNASDGALKYWGRKDNFRENLRPDKKYIMSGFHSGWTNDVMMGANLIHMALLTGRIPIVFPFPPSRHLRYQDDEAHIPPSIPFDMIFDLRRLSAAIGIPIVQMSELKSRIDTKPLLGHETDLFHPKEEEIGGFSIWMITNEFFYPKGDNPPEQAPPAGRRCYQLDTYNIKAHFTPVPQTFRPEKNYYAVAFRGLIDLFKPRPNPFLEYHLDEVHHYYKNHSIDPPKLLPEEQILYIDFLYNLGEGERDGRIDWTGKGPLGKVGAWESVGKHLRWQSDLEELAKGYLRRAFGVKDTAFKNPPSFIAVHIRRSDIGNVCADLTEEEQKIEHDANCYSPLSAYTDRVDEVKAELKMMGKPVPQYVLATTDEHGEDFLAQVAALGWVMLDHDLEGTIERYGYWYPTLIDSVSLSLGSGFVGTSGSTMSVLARRRVEDWNGGVGKQVSRAFGGLDGDD